MRRYLERNGYIVYGAITDGAHAFDNLCVSRDKKTVFIAEVKTKPRRKYYPDTGVDVRHYQEYKFIQDKYSLDVYIFFVDEIEKKVYGNLLRALDIPRKVEHLFQELSYPLTHNGIIYFPLVAMKDIDTLEVAVSNDLISLSTRNYDYGSA